MLCHDDELEERHIAFIYYLVPESWSKEEGGTLDLFDVDGEMGGNYTTGTVCASLSLSFFLPQVTLSAYVVDGMLKSKNSMSLPL